MLKQAKMQQDKNQEVYNLQKKQKKAKWHQNNEHEGSRRDTPTPLYGSPEPKMTAGEP